MEDYSELKRKAQEIRNEVKAGANTASRVGLALEETVNALEAENQRAMEQENSLANSIQGLQDDTEDLPSLRETVGGKQDKLQTYKETNDKAEVKMPNGNSYIRVTKDGAGMYAQDGKSGIVNSSSGSRLVYMETATDASGSSYTSHRDEISIGKHDGDNNATHITLTSKSTTEEDGEKSTNTSTIQVNPDGISMSSPEGEISDVVKEISGKASSESVSELQQEVEEVSKELDHKAPKIGYAPDLKVNFAKELVGRGEATPEVIGNIRPTGEISIGDGNATITRIKGESVVWNQHVNMGADLTGFGLTFSAYGLGGVRISGTPTQQAGDVRITWKKKPATVGHKILAKSNAQGISIRCQGSNVYNGISTATDTTLLDLVVSFNFPTDTAVDLVFYPEIVDLTLMFGAGNEPTTIEEFETRKPLNVTNEYNEGTIVSYNGDALKSVGFNAYNGTYAKVIGGKKYHATGTTSVSFAKELGADTTAITLDSEGKFIPEEDGYVFAEGKDIVIHLTHSYTPEHVDEYEEDVHPLPDVKSILDADGNQLFPNGLLSAGSVYDEITATKAIKRIGVVDMGSFNWRTATHSNGQVYFYTNENKVNEIKQATTSKIPANLMCIPYQPGPSNGLIASGDKRIARNSQTPGNLYVYDTSYTDATSFKQAMSGVLLYYELAEPIEVEFPEPLNMTYEAWDFGTEELVHEGATTPLNADIVYQFNAVDRIRENTVKNEELKAKIAALEETIKQLTAQTINEGGTSNEQM